MTMDLPDEVTDSMMGADDTAATDDMEGATDPTDEEQTMDPEDSEPAASMPSPGCGSGGGAPSITDSRVGTPMGYDGSTPVPVIFAFHAAGNGNDQLESRYGNTALGQNYLMIYPSGSGNGWNFSADKPRFDAIYDEVMNKACVDMNRVYATGHSSGSQFIVQLLCDGEDRFKAVAPVASSVYCNSWPAGSVPALVIHGVNDSEREAYGLNDGDGRKDLQPYLDSNGCGMESVPSDIDTAGCGGNIDPGCVDYQGCGVPTTWCNHNDPQYSNTNHGIPCFADSAIFDFFESLK
jgi:hypothetical protein